MRILNEVAELALACGLEVRMENCFNPIDPPMVYGPLDSIAILIDSFDQMQYRAMLDVKINTSIRSKRNKLFKQERLRRINQHR